MAYIFWMVSFAGLGQQNLFKKISYYDNRQVALKEVWHTADKEGIIKQGPFYSYFQNGSLKTKGNFSDNLMDGVWERFYENGCQKNFLTYKKGTLNGRYRLYFESGRLAQEGFYLQGKEDSTWRFYFESGRLKSFGSYKNGKQNGVWTYLNEDSTLKAYALLKQGVGIYKEYYASGEVKMEGLIRDGQSDSIWSYYHENGTIKATGREKNGERIGFWRFYHPNGIISAEGHFRNNMKDGHWKYFHETGALSSEGEQYEDQKDGKWEFYLPGGEKMGEANFVKGNGEYKEFYSNGKLKLKGKIENNKYEGLWTYFFEDGGLEGECLYQNGYGQYSGYYENGSLKMKGQMQNGNKVGSWDLFGRDGKVIGHYKTFYDMIEPQTPSKALPKKDTALAKPRNYGKPEFVQSRRKSRHFIPRINEIKGIIVAINPFAVALGSMPLSLEYYMHDRLGYEVMFTLIRQPFFANHSEEIENRRLYTQGNAIDFRQKLYSPDKGSGNLYVGQELRLSSLNHRLFVTEQKDSITTGKTLLGDELKIEFSLMVGNRFFQIYNRHRTLTLDIFGGIGFGYRISHYPRELLDYNRLKTNRLTIPVRAGFNFGYFF